MADSFSLARRRVGVPEDVAALVDAMTADETGVTLVNLDQREPRTVVVQAGAYGEHRCLHVETGGERLAVNGASFTVRLAPGAGARLVIAAQRYANPPTLAFPWDRR